MATVKISHREFLKIDRDYEKAASIAHLVYVSDKQPGISRLKKGKGFAYLYNGRFLHDKKEIRRIRSLAIPPAWANVWICPLPNGHLQATGFDVRNRKQYRYHAAWSVLRNETKFHKLIEFGKVLPLIRKQIEDDLSVKELTEKKVLATIITLMERTYMRVGNEEYEKQNGSYGLTTLKNRHVSVTGDKILFSFKGKKGIFHNITLRNKKLARIVQSCRDIPGKELFQYYDQEGGRKSVDSGMVNNYIREITGMDFTAKDIRTWAGSLNLLKAFQSIGDTEDKNESKKNIIAALDEVSLKLGNSRAICKKYYVHPGLIELYENNNLQKFLQESENIKDTEKATGLKMEEKLLMKILQSFLK